MKEWILYCVLCSLIYAMSARAENYVQQPLTADVVYWNKAHLSVLDCAVFLPPLDSALGKGATSKIMYALKTKGFSPSISPSLSVIDLSQADSAGHKVTEFYTDRDFKSLNRNGNNTLYLTLSGIRSSIQKKHKFRLSLYTIGRAKEIALTTQVGTLGQIETNVKDLPSCQPK